jgi:hypothetical protein
MTASTTRVAKPFPSGSVLHEFSSICYLETTAVQYILFLAQRNVWLQSGHCSTLLSPIAIYEYASKAKYPKHRG